MDRIILQIPQLDPEFVADQALAASPLIVECPIQAFIIFIKIYLTTLSKVKNIIK